jgi:hypothetical protein
MTNIFNYWQHELDDIRKARPNKLEIEIDKLAGDKLK